ncbi:acyl-CoA dehydrogenase family protein [Desulfofundulus sp.]|uniref:acyl-CoA dehydrogenase family protein n=1 Tax=Desulfofundulus sp. TaxID=2282750 RepID=UPI003C77B4A1
MGIYTEEHEIFRRTFKKFVEQELVPHVEEWEEKGEIPREIWKKLGEQGYLCPWLGEEYGGAGADFACSVIINEELARAGVSVAVGLHSDIIAPYIASYGTAEQKKRWLPGCASGDIILAIAMTEPNAGSDLQAIKTTARREGDHYVLNGQKTFISNGISADLVIVVCKTDPGARPAYRGISLIAVEDGTPGFIKSRKLKKLGLHSMDTAELFFDQCRVPAANLLGVEGQGFSYLMEKLQQERLISAIGSQGMAERMLADAIEYARTREAFQNPIGKFQHNAFKIAEMATEVEIGRAFLDSLIADHLAGKEIVTKVSMAKWWIGEMANRVAYQCLQLHGGYGYMEEYPIARFYRDVRAHTIYAGTSEIMKLIIAKRLGLG